MDQEQLLQGFETLAETPEALPKLRNFVVYLATRGKLVPPNMADRQASAVPLLAEQQRIVAKVDELMRWCDALEGRLTAAQSTAAHLLDATLSQILRSTA